RFHAGHTLARLGGDEFTILLDDLKDPADAVRLAERIMQVLKAPFNIGGHELYVSVSIGVALSSTTASANPDELLGNADTAMYCAKADANSHIEVFGPAMRASALARMQLENEMRRGIERGEFQNWYQLIVSLDSGKIRG